MAGKTNNGVENDNLSLTRETSKDLKMLVAGISGWSVASGRRKNEKQRLLDEDLMRLNQPKAKSWRWVDHSLEKNRDNGQVLWNKPLVQMPVIARQKKKSEQFSDIMQ